MVPNPIRIFRRETMRFWYLRAPWLEPLRSPNGLDLGRPKKYIQPSQEQHSAEYMIHTPLGSLNLVDGDSNILIDIQAYIPNKFNIELFPKHGLLVKF